MINYIEKINDNSLSGDVFNGQYSEQDTSVFTKVTFTADQWRTYSLASIIPDDGYDYEVMFESTTSTGTTSGNLVDIQLYSGTATSSNNANNFHTRIGRCLTRTSSTQICGGIGILPIKASDKKVTVRNADGSGTSGNYNCYVKRLRRIGTNKKSNDTKYISNINSHPIGGKLLDGQWISSIYSIASGLSIAKDVIKEYDLSSYLPDDNYSYEVMFFVDCRTGTTSGNTAIIRVGNTNYIGNPIIVNQITRANYYMQNGGNGRVVIGTNRKIYIGNSGNATSTNINFSVRAYRRVGTNSTTNIPNICIKSGALTKCYPIGGDIADGQWTKKQQTVFSATTFSQGNHSYTVNNYLPEDDTPYEISVFAYGRTGSTSGNGIGMWIEATNDVIGSPLIGYINTRTASSMCDSKCATIVCTQRNGQITLSIRSTGSSTTGNCGLYFDSYRKIGTNA